MLFIKEVIILIEILISWLLLFFLIQFVVVIIIVLTASHTFIIIAFHRLFLFFRINQVKGYLICFINKYSFKAWVLIALNVIMIRSGNFVKK